MAASEAGLTPTYFSRKFKEVVGTGFRDYVNFVRLGGAASLLRTTQLSIQEISRRCGFNSANYFGDAFRSAYGISPREFRKSEDVQQRAISIDLTEEDADDGLLADAGMNPADDAGRNTADDTGTNPADDAGNRPTDGS
jgi:AraC-like DNA-binding protein